MVADGELNAEFINVESEFGAASVVLGACATGARVFSTTTAQGLLLMAEVLFNISGLRLPVVITCANRAISAPINIWNDHSDAMAVRDAGWIMLFAEDCQEAADMHMQAYKIGENPEVSLPVMINMDGFILTHAFEPVEIFDQAVVDKFLPPYKPVNYLTTKDPVTMGVLAEPDWYMESRYRLEQAVSQSKPVIEAVANDFNKVFGRYYGGLVYKYRLDGAKTAVVSMGSLCGTLREVVDNARNKGEKLGLLKVRTFRPFPENEIYEALKDVDNIVVFEKAISYGFGGVLYNELKAAFYNKPKQPKISSFIVGLGGRDVPQESIVKALKQAETKPVENIFVDLKEEYIRR
jgi:pyruvate ferredoxin oxidoreductase alpha subunit